MCLFYLGAFSATEDDEPLHRHFIGGNLGVQQSVCGLYNLCMAFYRWQSGCAAVSLRSVQALQGIL